MNIPELEKLVKQYREDKSVIFQMPAVVQRVDCGSALCIGGQVCVNHGWKLVAWGHNADALKNGAVRGALALAAEILDLTQEQRTRLFLKVYWPEQFRDEPDTPALAADRIQHFIDTDGAE